MTLGKMAQKKESKGGSGSRIFEAADAGKILLDKEGRWFHEGVEITHRKTIELFSASVVKDPAGGYRLQVGKEFARIAVEDTPYMVRLVEASGDRVLIQLNDLSKETLEPGTLRLGKGNVLYCSVKNNAYPARFLRPAYYQIMELLDQDREGFFLRIGETRWPLRSEA